MKKLLSSKINRSAAVVTNRVRNPYVYFYIFDIPASRENCS
jgi:hypothetical protein